uniref:Myotubularin-related protein 9 n=1 Tax=Eptatretus burgeri TaxID=7764 RepID=A0A8C4QHW5_EPTBU
MEFADLIKTPKVDEVLLQRPLEPKVVGTLCLTGHHLIFSSRQDNSEELWLLHRNVDVLEKRFIGTVGTLTLKCKDLRIIHFDIQGMEECLNVAASVEVLSTLNTSLMYPFFHRPMFEAIKEDWQLYNPSEEIKRLSSLGWRLSDINKDYSLCPTYPAVIMVPDTIEDDVLQKSAAFRQLGRFPVLSYCHHNGVALLRCGQPLIGTVMRRCKEDERLVNAALGTSGKRGYILDTRSPQVAQQAKTRGGGFEPDAHYPQWRRIHRSIERPQGLQESFMKLLEACNDTSAGVDRWLSRLDACNWLGHIKDVLTTACVAAQCLDREGTVVLVHGNEGTDSTLQVTALAQLILQPEGRGLRGFLTLLEREWLQAGHPFQERCARSAYSTKTRQQAPSFLLFLDCCHQLLLQFPCSFEFSEELLICLFEHSYASQFGTFLGSNEQERKQLKLQHKTVSLWSWINQPTVQPQYLNPLYEPNSHVIWPSVAPQSLHFWEGAFLRWCRSAEESERARDETRRLANKHSQLQARVWALREQLAELERNDPGP